MNISDSGFEQIMQALVQQKHVLQELDRENQELRKQLADLRQGRDICIEILDQRFCPGGTTTATVAMAQMPSVIPTTPPLSVLEKLAVPAAETRPAEIEHMTDEISSSLSPSPGFLQEMIFDELAAAATSPMSVWQASPAKPSTSEEEEKAALRKELMGSFLLE